MPREWFSDGEALRAFALLFLENNHDGRGDRIWWRGILIWAAAAYPEGVRGTAPADTPAGPCGWG
eukprot:6768544-Lingulodinium_polyedra.AAC.1